MYTGNQFMTEVIPFRTYAKYQAHIGRRETLQETINRCMNMHLDKFPKLSKDIIKAFQKVHENKIMPSMRSLQFAGEAIIKNNARSYNCSYTPINDVRVFGEILFLLLSGVGVGFSVQKRHINQMPKVQAPREEGFFVAQDSIMGWAQCVDLLMDAYFYGRVRPQFDFGNIRPKGSYLVTTGAKAPGPEPLKKMLELVEDKLKAAKGRRLRALELHDIICIISDAVLAGGIRRAALISLFDRDDTEMLKCKHGEWWNTAPWRARANNSAVLPRNEVTKEEFDYIFKTCQDSNSGEPGFSFSDNTDMGFNPCVTGDTEILTRDGYKEIQTLVDTKTEIWNGYEWSTVTPKVTGKNQEMLTITFSDGRVLTCTKYHKFHIAKDYHGNNEIVNAVDLNPGMKLVKHKFPVIEHGENYENAYTQGFISAEGMDDYKFFWVYDTKYMCLKRLKGKATGVYKSHSGTERTTFHYEGTALKKEFVPFNWNLRSKLDWLAGLFDGDGTELKEGGLQISSIDRKFLSDVQKLLSTVSVQSKLLHGSPKRKTLMPDGKGGSKLYDCQESFRLCIGAVQMQDLKALGLKCERMSFNKVPQRDASQFVTIVDVSESEIADTVYCFNEPKNHTGIFNGVITGQCHEISLNPSQFCNLTTINQTGITSEKDFLNRVYSATLIGTLQASYTEFPYLRPIWKETTEREALLGVSFTGIADSHGIVNAEMLKKGAALVLEVNEKYAKKLGINVAARTTAIKPEGTSSCVLGSSSGIHARHSEYYLRRIRMNKDDALTNYLKSVVPELIEDDKFSATGSVLTIPQQSPPGAITRHQETAETLFKRAIYYNKNWVHQGYRSGDNQHNVSATISVKDNEWETLRELMWKHRKEYSGISLLPFDTGTYVQAPFEDCTKEKFEELSKHVKEIDLKQVKEDHDNTTRIETVACSGGQCEIV